MISTLDSMMLTRHKVSRVTHSNRNLQHFQENRGLQSTILAWEPGGIRCGASDSRGCDVLCSLDADLVGFGKFALTAPDVTLIYPISLAHTVFRQMK